LICEKARCSVKKEDSERSADGNSSEFTGVFSKHEPSSSEELPKIQSDFKVQKPNKSQEEIDSRRIWVGGISKNLNDKELFQFFTSFGEVEQAFVVTDDRGRSKGFAYVTFSSPSSANLVLKADKVEIQGKIVTTKSALPESVMNKNKIYVCNLNEDTEELSLFNYFKQFGTVVEAVIKDAGSHRFAFVRFELKDSVERVFDISSHSIDGKVVHCERAYGSRRSAAKSYSVEGSRASDQSVSEVGAGSSASVYHQNKSRTPKLERFKLL
jgi:RNA recognition motif-containing protein